MPASSAERLTYRTLIGVVAVVLLALVPLVGPVVMPELESTFSLTPGRYLSYVLTISVLVAAVMYAAEQQSMWKGLDVQVNNAVGRSALTVALVAIVSLDVVVWVALLSDQAIRSKVAIAAFLFHVMWIAGTLWLLRAGPTSTFVATCGGFLGAVIITTGAVLAIA